MFSSSMHIKTDFGTADIVIEGGSLGIIINGGSFIFSQPFFYRDIIE